jgi:hypothetical protein
MMGCQQAGGRTVGASTVEGLVEGAGNVEGRSPVEAAVRFVALQPGGARKILLEHHRRENGTCAGCLTSPVEWPCVVGVIATKALQLEPLR